MKFRFIIMAAGKGTRMGADVPKALVPVAGKPIIQRIYESVVGSGVDGKPIIVIGHERTRICEGFKGECDYVIQEEQLGTAHAVMVCKDEVKDADAVIVLNGDHPLVSPGTLRKLAELHERVGGVLSMMTTTVPSFDEWPIYSHWGRVIRDAHGHIIAIREFKDAMESEREVQEVNPSFFCFDGKWLWENIGQVKNFNANKEYYLTDLIELAVAQGHEINSMSIAPEEAVGINTRAELEIAEKILEKQNA